MKHLALLAALLVTTGLGACSGDTWFGDKEKPPLPGERKAVLDFERNLRPDPESGAGVLRLGSVQQNASWPQAGGNPSHVMQTLALSEGALKKVWSTDIGSGSRKNLPLTAQPVVAGESIFALDTDAVVSAFDTKTGKERWSVNIRPEDEKDPVIGGGVAFDSGILYATPGYDELVALDAANGAVKWRANLPSPSRAAPTVANGRVFVTTLSNTLLALNATDGSVLWEFAGLASSTALIGAASPAASGDLVVPAFSSGELYAIRAGNGSVAWSDNLASALRLGGITGLSDIRGLPVIDDGVVYAISFGGKAAAIDIMTGARLWQKDISGSKTPWVSGNRIFLISAESQIVSLDKQTGAVAWVSQLAKFKNKEKREGAVLWVGPILAGGRLLAFSSDSRAAEINPENGTLVREWDTNEDVRISPIVAGGTLYILSEDGDLVAYR